MPYYCTVPRCTSMAGKAKNVSFHQFPRDEGLADLWNTILKRGKPYTKYSKVCSLHFKPEDYTMTSVGKNKGQWRTLRKDAIPSQNLPSDSPTPQRRKSNQKDRAPPPLSPILQKLQIQQHLANAVFMQTVLAIQAANCLENQTSTSESDEDSSNNCNDKRMDDIPNEVPRSSSNDSDIEENFMETQPLTHSVPENRINLDRSNSYIFKCTRCSKCFMDFDVFLLHQRSHKDTATEKENYSKSLNI